ncbi:MAG: pyridoxamine 5'-phosphate oxidase family protein [Planctomycetes bacterium]|nr:pyridoxamine 5'-phosphate oxidase family protein [Planctomycetota bacterium]
MTDELLSEVHGLWRGADAGVLSTTSVAVPGYPFGSVVPYVTTPEGRPVIYVSGLAQHTKNLAADPRCCVTVVEAGGDAQAGWRISLLGDAAPVEGAEREAIAARYYARFPASARFAETHDFAFWAITPRRVRYIAGFGKIHWIEAEAWLGADPQAR